MFECRLRRRSDEFLFLVAALSIAVAPSGPIMLLLRFNDTRCLLNRSADARSSAPASVI